MDLSTTYMGLKLKNPLVPSAGPLTADVSSIKQLAEHGAAAVVLHSLFEEQIRHEADELEYMTTQGTESFAESLTYFPQVSDYKLGPEEYLEHIRQAKQAVDIPVIASLNGMTVGGWTDYADKMQQAGADAIELNIYFLATDPTLSADQVESQYVEILKAVKRAVTVPVALKLSPFFSATAGMARRLDEGRRRRAGLVQPLLSAGHRPRRTRDRAEVTPSTPVDTRLPLRWIAILYDNVKASLAATSGIGSGRDVLKAIMVGADVAQMCFVLLHKGPAELATMLKEMQAWMEKNEYESVEQLKGSLSQRACPDPAAFERANYMKALNNYRQ